MNDFALNIGKRYRTARGRVITITSAVPDSSDQHKQGFRFLDNFGTAYDEFGRVVAGSHLPNEDNLLAQVADDFTETTTTTTTTEQLPGFFSIFAEKMRRNPVKTSLTLGAATGVGIYGARNYRDHGSVLPVRVDNDDARVVVAAAASLFGVGR